MDDIWAEWTREAVERRLVAAYRALPDTPVLGRASGKALTLADGRASPMTQVLSWGLVLKEDPEAWRYLLAWARCMALRESFGEHCRLARWSRSTAEDGRRRGAEKIAAALAAMALPQVVTAS